MRWANSILCVAIKAEALTAWGLIGPFHRSLNPLGMDWPQKLAADFLMVHRKAERRAGQ